MLRSQLMVGQLQCRKIITKKFQKNFTDKEISEFKLFEVGGEKTSFPNELI